MSKLNLFAITAIGSLIGCVASIYPYRSKILKGLKGSVAWAETGREYANQALKQANNLLEKGKEFTHYKIEKEHHVSSWVASFVPLIAGIGFSLFLAPKNGKQFRGQVGKLLLDAYVKSQEVIEIVKNNSALLTPILAVASHAVARKHPKRHHPRTAAIVGRGHARRLKKPIKVKH